MATEPTLEEQIEELERELEQRKRLYQRWTESRKPKIAPGVAAQRLARLNAAIATLKRVQCAP